MLDDFCDIDEDIEDGNDTYFTKLIIDGVTNIDNIIIKLNNIIVETCCMIKAECGDNVDCRLLERMFLNMLVNGVQKNKKYMSKCIYKRYNKRSLFIHDIVTRIMLKISYVYFKYIYKFLNYVYNLFKKI